MKTRIIPILAAALIAASNSLIAQGPVNTGLVQNVSKEQGTLTLRTEQSGGGSIVYHGMDKAEILTVRGKPASLTDVSLGQRVSVFYKKSGDQWLISRVLIPEPVPATATATTAAPATTAVAPAATTRAATDGDITTQPAKNAAVDGDRTTRAPNTAATDSDRTTRPTNSAATDGDRTTVPADGARSGLRRK